MILIKHQKSCSSFQPSARLDDGQIRVNVWVRSHRGTLCCSAAAGKWPLQRTIRCLDHILCCQMCLKLVKINLLDFFKDCRRKGNDYNSNCRMKKVVDPSYRCSYCLNGNPPLKHSLFNILPVTGFTQAPVFIIPLPRSSNLVMNLINPRSPASTLLWLAEVTRFYWPDDLWGKWLRVFGEDIERKLQKSISSHYLLLF